ncbi:MAG: leucine-rich repeat protein [Oscillospiraceae bacterium]|nr:leucine-rich repeat protein [Oscillospiraceae bacterium]
MKAVFKRTLGAFCALSTLLSCVPLNAFAQSEAELCETECEVSFDEFAGAVSAMGAKYESNGFSGEIEIEKDGDVYIDGTLSSAEAYDKPVLEDGVFMADASVFEIFDENAKIDISDESVTISTENGEVSLSTDECASQNTQLVPVALVASELGYDVTQTDESVTLSNPFESARLIVKSTGDIDMLNAIDAACGYMNLNVLQFETPLDAYNAYLTYSKSDNVEFVCPSQVRSVNIDNAAVTYSASDGEYLSWGAEAMAVDGFNSTLTRLGKDEEEIVVAVIDTGVDLDHDDLSDRIIDSGANFSLSEVACAEDDQGHGTHVAGIICDLTLDNVKILPVKVLDSSGKGYDDGIFTGIMYAIENGADVINLSLGGYGHGDIYDDIFEYAESKGVVVCVAAGNDSVDAYRTVPASCEGVITVSALYDEDTFAAYSNFGETIEFAAPGSEVLSTYIDNQYAYLSGTSMACPHAAAAVAMLKSYDSALSTTQIQNILASCAVDLGESGRDELFGFGAICFDGINIFTEKCGVCEASVSGGEYDEAISVELSCSTEGAQIYYTLDSSVPTKENGNLYTGAIEISQSCILSAVAVCDGKYDGDVSSFRYIISNADSANCYTVENGVVVSYNGVLSDVVVPMEYDGQTITAIGESAFAENEDITSVALPVTITEIGDYAFKGCTLLESVDAFSVQTIGTGAFEGCEELSLVNVQSAVNIGDYAFYQCKSLEELECKLAESLGSYAFSECELLERVNAKSATVVGKYSFYNCKELYDCRLDYENITDIGAYAFYMCEALENEIICPSLQTLGDHSFSGCKSIECVYLGEGAVDIDSETFSGCRSLYYFGAPNGWIINAPLNCCGEVMIDVSDFMFDIITTDGFSTGTTFTPYSPGAPSITQTVSADELYISEKCAAVSYTAQYTGTHYIEISGAVLAEVEISGESVGSVSSELAQDSPLYRLYKAEFTEGETYSINADSKSPQPFSVMIAQQEGSLRQDISDFDVYYEDGVLSVYSESGALTEGVDFEKKLAKNGMTVFAKGDYKGAVRISVGDKDSLELGEAVELYSYFGGDEFVFVPETSQTYYFYALYSPERFVESIEYGTDLTVSGKILNSDRELIYTSTTCIQADCYSYTYFYIEAYLEAGETYYLQSDTNKQGHYSIKITDTIKLMFDTYIEMPSTQVATGGEIIPDITVQDLSDYTDLVCGEDYLVHITDNINPGSANVYIYGLGDYFGVAVRSFTITVEECETTELTLGTKQIFDIAMGGYAAASIQIEEEAKYRITFAVGNGTMKSYIKNMSTGISTQYNTLTVTKNLTVGEYLIIFYPEDPYSTNISVKVERVYDISDATVYVEDLEYIAGVTQIPEVTVRYGSTLLTEGVDYELSFVGNTPLPGVHYFGINGLGVYTGSATGSYNVDCSVRTSSATTISQGEHTVNITSAGSYKLYKFTAPDDGDYLLSTRENANVALVVFDQYGNTVSASSSPMGFGAEFTMSSGDVMYIAAMYYDATKTGSWVFEITSDYVLLENVEAVYDECVDFFSGKTLPDVKLVDGDYTLEIGVDYEYFYAANCTNYGTATICYRGLGKYKFNKYIEYTLVMPIDELYSNATALENNVAKLYDGDYYSCGVYSFTAPENAYYYFWQLEVIDMAFAQFYDENGKLIKNIGIGGGGDTNTRIFLKENETAYMLTGYYNCQNTDLYSGYLVKTTLLSRVSSYDYTENGITYTVFPSLSYAVVSGADSEITNVTLLDTIDGEYPVTEINASAFAGCTGLERLVVSQGVTEIGAFAFEGISASKLFLPKSTQIIGYRAFDNCDIAKLCILSSDAELITRSIAPPSVVYGYEETSAQAYCVENGVEYVVISALLGDLNNDGKVNSVDATISTRCALHVIEVDPDMNGDVNGDGVYNSVDATIITRYALKVIDKFPIEA